MRDNGMSEALRGLGVVRVRRGTSFVRLYLNNGDSVKVTIEKYHELAGMETPVSFTPTRPSDIVGVVRKGKNNLRVRLSNGATTLLSWDEYRSIMDSKFVSTFGVELEFTITSRMLEKFILLCRERGVDVKNYSTRYNTKGINKWLIAYDGSLRAEGSRRGLELKSPILHLDSPQDFADLTTVVTTLAECRAVVNSSCGFHVHFGGFSHDLDIATLLRMRSSFYNDEVFFDSVVSRSRRGNLNRYCQSVRPELAYTLRYQKLNVSCYKTIKTVEFRQHQGTTDITKVFNWIHLCRSFLERGFKSNWNCPTDDFASWLASLEAESVVDFTEFFTLRREELSA